MRGGENLEVQVSLGSLHFEEDPQWALLSAADRARIESTVVVHANGAKVLDAKAIPYACDPSEIYVAANPLGGSTCNREFTGTVISSVRIGALYLR